MENSSSFLANFPRYLSENSEAKGQGQNQAGVKSTSEVDSGKGFLILFFYFTCNKASIKEQLNLFSGGGLDAVVKEAGWNLGSSTARDPPALLRLVVRIPSLRCVVRDTHCGVCTWVFKRVLVPGSPGKQPFYKYRLQGEEITFAALRIFKQQKIQILSRRQTKLGEFN